MYSAFGVDHGEVSKAFNPIKAAKGAKKAIKGMPARGREKNYQRGFNQALTSRGQMAGQNTSPTLGSAWSKRSDASYRAGQQSGAAHSQRMKDPDYYKSPFS